jgi:predicted dehydrogenase
MIKVGIIGLGKMGISHCAIVNAHPEAKVTAVCDTSGMVLEGFKRYSNIKTYTDYKTMINDADLDCVFIATPTRFHADIATHALSKGVHTFCEKPFVLDKSDGERLADLAKKKSIINQVGYHNRFVATFRRVKELLDRGVIGDVYHFMGESHGPVVTKSKGGTWRVRKEEGGGCLYDYASHVINLIHYLIGTPSAVRGTMLKRVYSRDVEDAVYSVLLLDNSKTGILSVNWSDESYRKMTIQITVLGKKGKIIADTVELKVYLKGEYPSEKLQKGWNINYITDYPERINFYLRGEEYSQQVDYFLKKIIALDYDNINSFENAMVTDSAIHMLKEDAL